MRRGVSDSIRIRELLLILCRDSFSNEERRHAAELADGISVWSVFTDLAIRHGIAALIWQNIIDLHIEEKLPDTERKILEGSLLRTIARVTFITSVATEIICELEKNNIRALLLKGMALEHLVYGSRGLRQMSDIDLLVETSNALRARDILASLGFVSSPLKSSLFRHIILNVGNHLPEMHRSGISVDIHYRLFGQHDPGMTSEIFKNPAEVVINGKTCFVLSPETAYLSMVRHIRKHEDKGEFQLRLYNDIFLLLKKFHGEILVRDLLIDSGKAGIEVDVRRNLYIMKNVFKVDIPGEFYTGMTNSEEISGSFLSYIDNPGKLIPGDRGAAYRATLKSVIGLWSKVIFITGDIFPSTAFMKKRYRCNSLAGCLLRYPLRLGKLYFVFTALFNE